MKEQVLETIRNYGLLSRGDRCVLAVSGGADSMALLYILHSLRDELGIELRAVHVHHGLRGAEADRDAAWVEKNCDELGIPCGIRYVDVKSYVKETGTSVEEAARILRYRALFEEAAGWDAEPAPGDGCDDMPDAGAVRADGIPAGKAGGMERPGGDARADGIPAGKAGGMERPGSAPMEGRTPAKIAVAHNVGDNAETILMQMARGSGLKGLGGIDKKNGRIIRPLLRVKRSEIEEYLNGLGVSWVTDSTNLDDEYTRNRIRHRILPELERGVNSAAAGHIAAAGELISQAYEYIRVSAEKLIHEYADVMVGSGTDKPYAGNTPYAGSGSYVGLGSHAGSGSYVGPELDAGSEPLLPGVEPFPRGTEPARGCRFPIEILRAQPQILRSTVIMLLLGRICGTQKDISAVHIGDVVSLMDKETGKYIMLPYGLRARREYGYICIERCNADGGHIRGQKLSGGGAEIQEEVRGAGAGGTGQDEPGTDGLKLHFQTRIFDYSGEAVPTGEYTKWFDYDKIDISVSFRYRAPGDYIVLGGTGRKSIASYMTDRKIPGAQRGRIPLAADGSHIMWIVGYRISEAYKVTAETSKVLEIVYTEEDQ